MLENTRLNIDNHKTKKTYSYLS